MQRDIEMYTGIKLYKEIKEIWRDINRYTDIGAYKELWKDIERHTDT